MPPQTFWLECAPKNTTKLFCRSQVSFEATALKILIRSWKGWVFQDQKARTVASAFLLTIVHINKVYSWFTHFCRKLGFVAIFRGHFLLKFGAGRHKNILKDRVPGSVVPLAMFCCGTIFKMTYKGKTSSNIHNLHIALQHTLKFSTFLFCIVMCCYITSSQITTRIWWLQNLYCSACCKERR